MTASGSVQPPSATGTAQADHLAPLAGAVGSRILLSHIQSVSRCGQFLMVASLERCPRLKPCAPLVKTWTSTGIFAARYKLKSFSTESVWLSSSATRRNAGGAFDGSADGMPAPPG